MAGRGRSPGYSNWRGALPNREMGERFDGGYGGRRFMGGGGGGGGRGRMDPEDVISHISQQINVLSQQECNFGAARFDQDDPYDNFAGPGWAPGGSNGPGYRGGGGRRRRFDHGKLPSLLEPLVFPAPVGFQPPPGPFRPFPPSRGFFPYRRNFSGPPAEGRRRRDRTKSKRNRRRNSRPAEGEEEDEDDEELFDSTDEERAEHDGKKRKQSADSDEPESKLSKTEGDAEDDFGMQSDGDESTSAGHSNVLSIEEELAQLKKKFNKDSDKDADDDAEEDEEEATTSKGQGSEDGKKQRKVKQKVKADQLPDYKPRKKQAFFDMSGYKIASQRLTFVCSLCKFRTFYKSDMDEHLESPFHKAHCRFVAKHLPKSTMDFLQEHMNKKRRKVEATITQLENHSAAICQVLQGQDLTRGISMDHFIKKAEAAHCEACDVYIPMEHHLIHQHLRGPDHNYNRRFKMGQSRRQALSVTRCILNHKLIRKDLERFVKGEDPFDFKKDNQGSSDTEEPEKKEKDTPGGGEEEEGGEVVEKAELEADSEAVGNGEGQEVGAVSVAAEAGDAGNEEDAETEVMCEEEEEDVEGCGVEDVEGEDEVLKEDEEEEEEVE